MVKVGVLKGTGKERVDDGQHKVVNTALYVLMQRTVVPGCPLTGRGKAEKDSFKITLMAVYTKEATSKPIKAKMIASKSVVQRKKVDIV